MMTSSPLLFATYQVFTELPTSTPTPLNSGTVLGSKDTAVNKEGKQKTDLSALALIFMERKEEEIFFFKEISLLT